jgi:hypothetical protein
VEALQAILMDDIKGSFVLSTFVTLLPPSFWFWAGGLFLWMQIFVPNFDRCWCWCRDRPQREWDRHHCPVLPDPTLPPGSTPNRVQRVTWQSTLSDSDGHVEGCVLKPCKL